MTRRVPALALLAAATIAMRGAAIAAPSAAPASGLATVQRALFAREREAAGGDRWTQIAAIVSAGTQTSGDAPSTFQSVVDHRTGYSRNVVDSGPVHDVSGFDGTVWDAQGGAMTQADLPALVEDAVTAAYMARDGWWDANDPAEMTAAGERTAGATVADVVSVVPKGGSAVDVWLDRRTHLIDRTVQHTDQGDVTTTYDDYRTIAGVRLPFHQVSVDPTGARTDQVIRSASLPHTLAASMLARPAPQPRASFAGPAPAVIPFTFDSVGTGHIAIPVTFGTGTTTVDFDSGGANFLLPDAAKKLGIRTGGGSQLSGVGDASLAAAFGRVGIVAVGTARLAGQTAIVAPLPYGFEHPRAGLTVEGLVGWEMLNAFRTTIDYAHRTIAFAPFDAPAPAGGTTIPFVSDGQHAYVHAAIDGVDGLFGLDTGDDGGLTIFRQFTKAHPILTDTGLAYVSPGGVGGTLAYRLHRASSFTIAGTTLRAPLVTVSEATAGSFASRSISGNIGARILDRFTLTFDYHARTVTFAPNANANAPFPADRTGLSLDQHDAAGLNVLSVVAGSPADAAGIHTGDSIVAIDGRSVAAQHLGIGDVRPYLVDRTTDLPLIVERGGKSVPVTLHPRTLL